MSTEPTNDELAQGFAKQIEQAQQRREAKDLERPERHGQALLAVAALCLQRGTGAGWVKPVFALGLGVERKGGGSNGLENGGHGGGFQERGLQREKQTTPP